MARRPARWNHLNARLGFSLRDWRFELDGVDDDPYEDQMLRGKKLQKIWRRKLRQDAHRHPVTDDVTARPA